MAILSLFNWILEKEAITLAELSSLQQDIGISFSDQSVLKQMEMLAAAKSLLAGGEILYGVIDGEDSNRLWESYKNRF